VWECPAQSREVRAHGRALREAVAAHYIGQEPAPPPPLPLRAGRLVAPLPPAATANGSAPPGTAALVHDVEMDDRAYLDAAENEVEDVFDECAAGDDEARFGSRTAAPDVTSATSAAAGGQPPRRLVPLVVRVCRPPAPAATTWALERTLRVVPPPYHEGVQRARPRPAVLCVWCSSRGCSAHSCMCMRKNTRVHERCAALHAHCGSAPRRSRVCAPRLVMWARPPRLAARRSSVAAAGGGGVNARKFQASLSALQQILQCSRSPQHPPFARADPKLRSPPHTGTYEAT